MSITIRGKEYAIAHVTDTIARTISDHVNTSVPLLTRHASTWAALKASLEPELPDELFKGGLLLLNDAEIVPVLKAIAEALTQDKYFQESVGALGDVMPLTDDVKGAIAVLQPATEKPTELPGLTPEEVKLIMAVRSAKTV